MKKMKNLSEKIILSAVLFCFFSMFVGHMGIIHAEEMQMLYTTEEVNLYQKENLASKIMDTIEKGIPVMVLEQDKDFCKVQYKDHTGYVETSKLQVENAEVAEEIEEQKAYNSVLINEIIRMEDEKKKSRIWGSVIVGLVVLIFGSGIFHTVRTNRIPKTDRKMQERIQKVIEEAANEGVDKTAE